MSWSTATSKDRIKGVGLKADLISTRVHLEPLKQMVRLTSGAGFGLRDQLLRDGGNKVLDFKFSLCAAESVNSVEREDAKDILRNLRH